MNCKFIKKDNKQCQARTRIGSSYCFFHDPEKEKEKQLATIKGGMASKKTRLNYTDDLILNNADDAKKVRYLQHQ